MHVKSKKQLLHEEYERLSQQFGIFSRLWNDMYTSFSWYIFCKANRKYIIAMYLLLEEFAKDAKEADFVYFWGIDKFLEEYKAPVYRCLKTGDKEFSCGD